MKPLKRSVSFLILVSLMSFVATITTASGAPLENDIYLPIVNNGGDLEPIIPETTVVITEETTDDLVSISDDLTTLTFAEMTPELEALDPGDVMAGGISPQAPYGFLRKVVSVTDENGNVVVRTEDATLGDAIEQGTIRLSKQFTAADIESITLAEGVILETSLTRSNHQVFSFSFKDKVVHDLDGNLGTTVDQIRADGYFQMKPGIGDTSFEFKSSILDEMIFPFSIDQEAEIILKSEAGISFKDKVEIANIDLGISFVQVGVVPIVFHYTLPIYIQAEGDVSAGVYTSVVQKANISAEFGYRNEEWYRTGELTNEFTYESPSVAVEAMVKAALDPTLFVKLYGEAGIGVSISPYLKYEASLSKEAEGWKLSAGMDGKIKAEATYFGVSGADYENTLWSSNEKVLAEGEFSDATQQSTPTEVPPTPTSIPDTGTAPIPSENYINSVDEATYLYVPAGEFIMGSEDGHFNEDPEHTVYLDEYWIMETEVTNAQYRKFMEADGYTTEAYWSTEGWAWRGGNIQPRYWDHESYSGDQQPVVGINWYEAEAYANWLSLESGLNVGLPTEAQWEKAARGTNGRIYPWGDEWDASKLNAGGDDDGYQYTSPVGSFPEGASPYGVLDMAGNVWEWTADWYDSDYYDISPERNPTGPESGDFRAVHGDGWFGGQYSSRSSHRIRYSPAYRFSQLGARLVLLPPSSSLNSYASLASGNFEEYSSNRHNK